MGTIQIDGSTPKLTIGNATAEDATILFDGNAQDFYIALDDSADDLLIGLGSTVGTTPAIAIDENLKVNIPVTTASTSASTGSLTTGGGAGIGADLYVGDDVYLITDSAVLGFGADKDTTLTHTDGTGLTLNGTNKLCFNDASQFIQGASNAILDINATDEIELNATAIDLNGTLDVSGTLTVAGATTQTGLLTVAAGINFPDTMSEQADVNTLDDYEEGNWTPVYFGLGGTTAPTYSVQSGKYTKVGRSVTLTGTLTITAHDATGNMNLSGFPFTVGGSSDAGYYAAWDFFMGDTGWQSLPAADYSGYPGVNVDRGPMHYVASGEGHGQTYFVIQTHCAGDATCALHFRLNYFTD